MGGEGEKGHRPEALPFGAVGAARQIAKKEVAALGGNWLWHTAFAGFFWTKLAFYGANLGWAARQTRPFLVLNRTRRAKSRSGYDKTRLGWYACATAIGRTPPWRSKDSLRQGFDAVLEQRVEAVARRHIDGDAEAMLKKLFNADQLHQRKAAA